MVSTTWIRWTCFLCLSSSAVVVSQGRQPHVRFKRIINVTDVQEISIADHDSKYPFIVGIKTEQHMFDGKNIKKTMRCTGTMLSSQLVLTTGYCVRNAIDIKVYKHDNPGDKRSNESSIEVKIRTIPEANEYEISPDLRQYPNPLFYGDMINRYNKWFSVFPRDDDRMANLPIRNLAIVYLETPLYSDANMTIYYPTIVANPSNFVSKNKTANLFGWCQMGISNETAVTKNVTNAKNITLPTKAPVIKVYNKPRLTMITVQVGICDIDRIYEHNLCIDKNLYKDAFCELDQGGPLIMKDDKVGESKPTKEKLQMSRIKVLRITAKTNNLRPRTTYEYKMTTAKTKASSAFRQGKADTPAATTPPPPPKSEKLPPPSLVGMINTYKSHGHLTYLWPYADWIYSVMDEYGIRPTAVPTCPSTATEFNGDYDDLSTTAKLRIESYYDDINEHRKIVQSVDIPCDAPPTVVSAAPCQIAVLVASTVLTLLLH